ncbi:MAG: biopolymer transporter ExbD [Prevotellaceae bacterium]|jgi:biopolymer transport protein ExbD|nr:biopolymer transporter ExbD [Prevotellaceae bacterium]
MAEVQEKDKGGKKKGKQKKMHIHVDFTPMVDMNMLLICFFMLATSMSKPQTMEIVMPAKETKTVVEPTKVADDRAVTVLLDGEDKLYYYEGDPSKTDPDYKDYNTLKETSYDAEGLRAYLIGRNKKVVEELREFKNARDNIQNQTQNLQKQLSSLNEKAVELITKNKKDGIDAALKGKLDTIAIDAYKKGEGSLMDGYKKYVNEIKKSSDESPIIVLKASDFSTYENLINVLDEMQICGISTYAVVNITLQDLFLIENYKTKGAAAQGGAPK